LITTGEGRTTSDLYSALRRKLQYARRVSSQRPRTVGLLFVCTTLPRIRRPDWVFRNRPNLPKWILGPRVLVSGVFGSDDRDIWLSAYSLSAPHQGDMCSSLRGSHL